MKKICVTIRSLANGGAEKQSLLLAKALQDNYEVFYVAVNDDEKHPKHLAFIEEHQINALILEGGLLSRARQFGKFVKQHQIDYIFSFLPGDTMFGGIVGKLYRVKNVYGGIRNAQIAKYKVFFLRMLSNFLLTGIISNSHKGKGVFSRIGFRADRILVIPNALEVQEESVKRPPKEQITIITVARFVPQKDFLTALKSIAALKEHLAEHLKIKYHIVGYGEQEEAIRNWVQSLGLDDLVEIIINPENIRACYRSADVYLCSSIFEGVSNTILEAMEHSLPVVATDVGDNQYLVQDGYNGFIAPSGDSDALSKHLHKLVQDHDMRIQFGLNSYEKLIDEYSFKSFQQNYIDIIEGGH